MSHRRRARLRAFKCRMGVHNPRGFGVASQWQRTDITPAVVRPCRHCRTSMVVGLQIVGLMDLTQAAFSDEFELDERFLPVGVERVTDITISGVFG